MTVSIVNGYVCTSCCDVAKAKKGEDPHPALHAGQTDSENDATRSGPAVLFGGTLSNMSGADGVKPIDATESTDAVNWRTRKLTVDLLV